MQDFLALRHGLQAFAGGLVVHRCLDEGIEQRVPIPRAWT
jgi:hypothetical protein